MKDLLKLNALLFILLLPASSLIAQYSNDDLNQLILNIRDLEKQTNHLSEEMLEATIPDIIKVGNEQDYQLMLKDASNYIRFIGQKIIIENNFPKTKPLSFTRTTKKEWKAVIANTRVRFINEKVWIGYASNIGGYNTFHNFDTPQLEKLLELDNPITKYLALRAFIFHRNEMDADSKLLKLKDYIRKIGNDKRLISIHEGCVSNLGNLSYLVFYLVQSQQEFKHAKVDWKAFFEKENITLEKDWQ